jgi:hypothetical protein
VTSPAATTAASTTLLGHLVTDVQLHNDSRTWDTDDCVLEHRSSNPSQGWGYGEKTKRKREKKRNNKQNLSLHEKRINDLDLTMDYNEGNDRTDESLTNDTDEVSQDKTFKGITLGLRNLQPSAM